jgi:hypothetical protein
MSAIDENDDNNDYDNNDYDIDDIIIMMVIMIIVIKIIVRLFNIMIGTQKLKNLERKTEQMN